MAISMTSAGIVFTGTQSPGQSSGTGTSFTLDDFEEGTWTPVGSQISFAVNLAAYTKIGRYVHIQAYCDGSSGVGNPATCTGVPFTSVTNGYATGVLNSSSGNPATSGGHPHVRMGSNNTTINFYRSMGSDMDGADFDSGHVIWQISYMTG